MTTEKNTAAIDVLRNDLASLKEALKNDDKVTAKEVADRIVMTSMHENGTINMKAALPYIVKFASERVFKLHNIQSTSYQNEVIEENIQTVFTWLYDGRILGWSGDPVCAIQNTISLKGTYIGNNGITQNFGFTSCFVTNKENNKTIYMHVPGISDVVVGADGEETSIFDMEDVFDRETAVNKNLGFGGAVYRSVEENVFGRNAEPVIDDVAGAITKVLSEICNSKGLCYQDFIDFCVDYSERRMARLYHYGDAQKNHDLP